MYSILFLLFMQVILFSIKIYRIIYIGINRGGYESNQNPLVSSSTQIWQVDIKNSLSLVQMKNSSVWVHDSNL